MSTKDNGLTTQIPIKDKNGNIVGHKEVALYAGLLAKAHNEGLKGIRTELVQVPLADNDHTAIVSAKVETGKGIFCGIGDAHEGNVNHRIAPHLIRMAETRAKARALRDAVNIGVVALDELGELLPEDVEDSHEASQPRATNRGNGRGNGRSNGRGRNNPMDDPMTVPQRRLLLRLMAEKGIRGKTAEDQLCHMMGIDELERFTKRTASEAIDQLQGSQGDSRAQH